MSLVDMTSDSRRQSNRRAERRNYKRWSVKINLGMGHGANAGLNPPFPYFTGMPFFRLSVRRPECTDKYLIDAFRQAATRAL